MMTFTITYVYQCLFGQGFRSSTVSVVGAKAAKRVLDRIRGEGANEPYAALMVWVTCE